MATGSEKHRRGRTEVAKLSRPLSGRCPSHSGQSIARLACCWSAYVTRGRLEHENGLRNGCESGGRGFERGQRGRVDAADQGQKQRYGIAMSP